MARKTLLKSVISMSLGLFALLGVADAATFDSRQISFRNITGAVEIITTSGDEIDISIRQGMIYQPVKLFEKDGVVVIETEAWRDAENDTCCDNRIRREVHLRKDRKMITGQPVDEDLFRHYPTYVISMPLDGDVEFIDARIKLDMDRLNGALSLDACYVYGETGDLDAAMVNVVHGSRLVMGNIAAGLELDLSGDADVMAGDVAMVDIDIAGPGDVILGAVDGMMDVSIAGSGIVRATRMNGPVTARIAGSGGVFIKDGNVNRLRAIIDGSGGVYVDGAVSQPDLRLSGSAEIRMKSVAGRIRHHGGGSVYVDGVLVEK